MGCGQPSGAIYVDPTSTGATPTGTSACPLTSITAANALIQASTPGTFTSIYLERGTYASLEAAPLTILDGITVEPDPAGNIGRSEVTLFVPASATGVQVNGTLSTVTVTCSGAASGTCPGVMLRMNQGAPELENVAIVGPPANSAVACVDVDSDPQGISPINFTATIGAGTSISGCQIGIRMSNGGSPTPTVSVSLDDVTITNNSKDGVTIDPGTAFSVSITGSTIEGNTGDGIWVEAPASGLGTFALTLGDASCGNASQNQIYCNTSYGIENDTSLVLAVDDDTFGSTPPSVPPSAGATPYDLNSAASFSGGACTTAHGACSTCPSPTNPLYVSIADGTASGNGSSACPFATITAALAATSSSLNEIALEPGTYSAETFPITIPAGITVEADPSTVTQPSQVVLDGPVAPSGFPWTVYLEGTLTGVTVTNTYAANCAGKGNCGALVRMQQGSPVLENSVLLGASLADGGPLTNAGITMNVSANGDSLTCQVSEDSITGFTDGIRFTLGDDGTINYTISDSEIGLNVNDGLNIGGPGAGSTLNLSVSGSRIFSNLNDGVQINNAATTPSAISGTLNLTLGSASDCGASTTQDNSIICNGAFGVENDATGFVVNLSADQFENTTPTAPATAAYGTTTAPYVGAPYDLNIPGSAGFSTSCYAPAATSCP